MPAPLPPALLLLLPALLLLVNGPAPWLPADQLAPGLTYVELAKYLTLPLLLWLLTRFFSRRDRRHDAAEANEKDVIKARQAAADEERAALRKELVTLQDDARNDRSDQMQWQLKREAELASIAGILEESTEAHKLLASIAATSQAHGGQLGQLHDRLNTMQQHLNQLSLYHGKS